MTLSVFAAERRAAAPLLLRARSPPPSILSARRSAVNPLDTAAAVDWWDRQTDRWTDARQFYTPCSTYYAGSVNTATTTTTVLQRFIQVNLR